MPQGFGGKSSARIDPVSTGLMFSSTTELTPETWRYVMNSRTKALAIMGPLFLVACNGQADYALTDRNAEALQNLEEVCRIEELKQEIFEIASANTTNQSNLAQIRAELDPLVDELALYFQNNRPENEAELTQGAWQNVWLDDADIGRGPGFIKLEFDQIYQVVEADYYYNVSNNKLSFFGGLLEFPIYAFLRGNYDLIDVADETTNGLPRRNVIDLEFADNKFRFGSIPEDRPLAEIVDEVANSEILVGPIPGPAGITGELWNLYIDDDLRIAAGIQTGDESTTDLYVTRRVEFAGPIEPLPVLAECL
jgi:hypothetical protein